MSEPCNFPTLESCHKRLLWTRREVDLAPHPIVGLVLKVGDAEKFPQAIGFESLFFQRHSPCFTATDMEGGNKRLAQCKLACEADGVPP